MTTPKPIKAVRAIVSIYREFEQLARRSDISLAQYRLMLYLRGGPRRAGEIAAAGALAKPTVSLALNALRDKGWIASAADADDGRATRVEITPAGVARMAAFEAELAARIGPLLGEGADVEAFNDILSAANDALRLTREERLADVERTLLG